MGVNSLKNAISHLIDRPLIALATHTHFDRIGSVHEFEHRLVYPSESYSLLKPDDFTVLCCCHWPEGMRTSIEQQGYEVPNLMIDAYPNEHFDPMAFRLQGSEATRLIDEDDIIDLGDIAFQAMHLQGHSPGGIGLWNKKTGTSFDRDRLLKLIQNYFKQSV
ncbi:MAG: glyoxylase-like metal-dependent hydrolase (beta-lactamase superfamily II) [Oleiphilaceae bacterium]|jgi:glyoxylase-like metal-dependent hydrolase (beta-lactamase superfamily II)